MSQIYVAEFSGLGGTDQGDSVSILPYPPSAEYTVIVSAGSSGAAQPIRQGTKFLGISCDTTCSIAIGGSPGVVGTGSAGLTNTRLAANERIVLRVPTSAPAATGNPYNAPVVPFSVFTTANV